MTREDKNTTKCYCGHTTYCDCSPLVSKQTAVEWLVEQLEQHHTKNDIKNTVVFQQAKAMEKEQIVDAYVECWKANMPDGYECKKSAEQYYNETYNK